MNPASVALSPPPWHMRGAHAVSLAVATLLLTAGAGHAQSLSAVYELARKNDAQLQSVQAQLDAAQAKAEQARAGLLPQAGLGAGANWVNLDNSALPQSRSTTNQNVALQASQPLYRPVNALTRSQGALGAEVAKAQLASAEQALMVRTAQAYFDVVAAQDSLAFVQAQKTAVGEQLAAAKRNFEVGTATVVDSREAQSRFDLVLAQEIAVDNDAQVKRLALDQLVGQNGLRPLALKDQAELPSVLPANPELWVEQALRNNPTVQQLDTAFAIAEVDVQKAQAGHKPTLDLVGQYQLARGPNTFNPGAAGGNVRSNTASVGLQFNLPLYAGGAIQNRVKEALALVEKSRADREAALRELTQGTRAAYFGVVSGLGQVKALEAAEASSQVALDANKLGYQVGVRINIDVLNAQSQLFQTKRDLALARYQVLVGQLRLKQASGALAAADLQGIDGLLKR